MIYFEKSNLSYTKEQCEQIANQYSEQLRAAGYDRTCRLGVYGCYDNVLKIRGIMNVCSVVVIDEKASEFEKSHYDVDIWKDEVPPPRFNQCTVDEVIGYCSSGSTDTPRIIPWHNKGYQYELEYSYKTQSGITPADSTWNVLPLWAPLGQQVFNSAYDIGATFYILDQPYRNWPEYNPTFLSGSPNVLNRLVDETAVPYDTLSIREIRANSAPLYKELKQKVQNFFNCITTDCYGMSEVGSISAQTYPQKYGSVGFINPERNVEFGDDGEIIVDGFPTGDVGYIDQDGFLFVRGRKKEVINKGGVKIMPFEVEQAMIQCGVQDVVVFGYDEVYAVVEGKVDYEKLRTMLKEYKLPTRIYYVKSIPRRATGKINRSTLLDWCRDQKYISYK